MKVLQTYRDTADPQDPCHSQALQNLVSLIYLPSNYYISVTADKEIKEEKDKEGKDKEIPSETETDKTGEDKITENNNVIDDVKQEVKEEIKTEVKEQQPAIENE